MIGPIWRPAAIRSISRPSGRRRSRSMAEAAPLQTKPPTPGAISGWMCRLDQRTAGVVGTRMTEAVGRRHRWWCARSTCRMERHRLVIGASMHGLRAIQWAANTYELAGACPGSCRSAMGQPLEPGPTTSVLIKLPAAVVPIARSRAKAGWHWDVDPVDADSD